MQTALTARETKRGEKRAPGHVPASSAHLAGFESLMLHVPYPGLHVAQSRLRSRQRRKRRRALDEE